MIHDPWAEVSQWVDDLLYTYVPMGQVYVRQDLLDFKQAITHHKNFGYKWNRMMKAVNAKIENDQSAWAIELKDILQTMDHLVQKQL